MDRQFHLLDTFAARGSDGQTYKVCAYEHLRRDETINDGQEHWLPTGVFEYRLASGDPIDARADGSLVIARSGIALSRLKNDEGAAPDAGGERAQKAATSKPPSKARAGRAAKSA
jgi:hypothetical protein